MKTRRSITWIPEQAHHQHGVFTLDQAIAGGMGRGEAQHRLKVGAWQRVAGRGLMLAGLKTDPLARAWALSLTWPTATIWGPSALQLWVPDAPIPQFEQFYGAFDHHRRSTTGLKAKLMALDPSEVTVSGGLRLQTIGGALVDTMRLLREPQRGGLFAWAFTRDKVRADSFVAAVERRKGASGIGALADYVAMAVGGVVSHGELRTIQLFKEHGITGWRANVPIRLPDGRLIRVDFLFANERLIVEVDGWAYHSSKRAFAEDRRRDAELGLVGYLVIRLTWEQITEQPEFVVGLIREALTRADR